MGGTADAERQAPRLWDQLTPDRAEALKDRFTETVLTRVRPIAHNVHIYELLFTYMNEMVKSATRVLDVLELFTAVTEPLGVSDVAKRLELPKSSAQALLLTLLGRGYLSRGASGYTLPPDLKGGWVGGIRSRLLGAAGPAMKRMSEESGESAFVGVITSGGKIQYLAKAVSANEVRYDASLSHLRPLHCTSIGLVILANMDEKQAARWLKPSLLVPVTPKTETDPARIERLLQQARRDGYVEVRDANIVGAAGVSAPIFGPTGGVIAGLNLGAPTARYESARNKLIRIVCREAKSITAALKATTAEKSAAA